MSCAQSLTDFPFPAYSHQKKIINQLSADLATLKNESTTKLFNELKICVDNKTLEEFEGVCIHFLANALKTEDGFAWIQFEMHTTAVSKMCQWIPDIILYQEDKKTMDIIRDDVRHCHRLNLNSHINRGANECNYAVFTHPFYPYKGSRIYGFQTIVIDHRRNICYDCNHDSEKDALICHKNLVRLISKPYGFSKKSLKCCKA
ncbi:MAG: hypothetical protein Edafosvirus1_136 [Edafosvirus sp.]|uniref:Uncharacterized protein n=1 Tax=Edafosvirus sp. TaxID=2487765 RepID=A0A3G4ZSE1_9VIRU|nr:MAG: hypothetical protein Edafosvirus1_136 [Edafosvirus sp.]